MSEPATVEETLRARWGRRAVTVPLYLSLGVVTVALLPLTVLAALATDMLRRTGTLVTVRCVLGITLYLVCEAGGIVASAALWAVPALWSDAEGERAVTWNRMLRRAMKNWQPSPAPHPARGVSGPHGRRAHRPHPGRDPRRRETLWGGGSDSGRTRRPPVLVGRRRPPAAAGTRRRHGPGDRRGRALEPASAWSN